VTQRPDSSKFPTGPRGIIRDKGGSKGPLASVRKLALLDDIRKGKEWTTYCRGVRGVGIRKFALFVNMRFRRQEDLSSGAITGKRQVRKLGIHQAPTPKETKTLYTGEPNGNAQGKGN